MSASLLLSGRYGAIATSQKGRDYPLARAGKSGSVKSAGTAAQERIGGQQAANFSQSA